MPAIQSAVNQMSLVAASPLAGVALVNGTPTILTWTAPNDGKLHRVLINAYGFVTSAQTGGQITFNYTDPAGNAVNGATLMPGGAGAGPQLPGTFTRLLGPGGTLTILQFSAQTAGAATFWYEIWGG